MKKVDLTSKIFGRLTVIAEAPKRGTKIKWLCVCECGAEVSVAACNLNTGHTSSCGCLAREVNRARAIERNTVHGHNTVALKSPTWQTWHAMICRCEIPTHVSYHRYGGRGIKIHVPWRENFVNFLEDMGERPEGMCIERKNVHGNYEPGNCRWATAKEQQHNRHDNWWKWAANDNGGWTRVAA